LFPQSRREYAFKYQRKTRKALDKLVFFWYDISENERKTAKCGETTSTTWQEYRLLRKNGIEEGGYALCTTGCFNSQPLKAAT